jgi:hypothetical protein
VSEAEGDLARITRHGRLVNLAPSLRQILPMRIHRLNEPDFLSTSPALDLLFAVNGRVRIEEALVVCQTSRVVPARETLNKLVLVFKYAPLRSPVMPV